jgi:hypothetical protein
MARSKQKAAEAARLARLDGGHASAIIKLPVLLFTKDDIPALFDGVELLSTAEPIKLAAMLDFAVRLAVTVQGREDRKLPVSAEIVVFQNIRNYAIGLLDALGYSGDWDENAGLVLVNFAGLIRFGTVPELPCDLTDEQRGSAAEALLALPKVLENLIKLATHSAVARRQRSKRGDRAEYFGRTLFSQFCMAWEVAVGSLPNGRIKGDTADETLCGVVRRVATHAADRLADMKVKDLIAHQLPPGTCPWGDPATRGQVGGHPRQFSIANSSIAPDVAAAGEQLLKDTSRSAKLLQSLAWKPSATIAGHLDAAVRQHRTFRKKLQDASEG